MFRSEYQQMCVLLLHRSLRLCSALCWSVGQRVVSGVEGSSSPLWLPVRRAQQGVHAVPLGGEGPQEVSGRRPQSQRMCT